MWVEHTIQKEIVMPPSSMDKRYRSEVQDDLIVAQLNILYRGKVIPDLGLCICVHKIVRRDQFEYKLNQSWPSVSVKFSALFFFPYPDELLPVTPTCVQSRGIWFRFGSVFAHLFVGKDDIDEELKYFPFYDKSNHSAYSKLVVAENGEEKSYPITIDSQLCLMRVKSVEFFSTKPTKMNEPVVHTMWVRLSMKNMSCAGPTDWFFDSYQGWYMERKASNAVHITPPLPDSWPESKLKPE